MSTFPHQTFPALHATTSRIHPAWLRVLRTFALSLAFWTFVGMVFMGQDITRRIFYNDPALWREAGFWTIRVVLSAALTPGILWLSTIFPLEKRVWARRTSLHMLFSLCFGVVRTALEALAYSYASAGWGPAYEWTQDLRYTFTVLLIFGFHQGLIAYWFILIIHTAIRYYEQFQERAAAALRLELNASELRAQLTQAQLGALKMQLQPHFLFNTLNAIMGMVRVGEMHQAERALSRFSDLLRAVLDDMDTQEVTLERELTYVRLYLSIEQIRFTDRLTVRIEADPDVLDASVPHMALQPLVENAVRHGIGCRVDGGSIDVRATRVGNRLHIRVQDCGVGPRTHSATGRGLGLSNLRTRLKELYGADGTLRIECSSTGAAVDVVLPYRPHIVGADLTVSME